MHIVNPQLAKSGKYNGMDKYKLQLIKNDSHLVLAPLHTSRSANFCIIMYSCVEKITHLYILLIHIGPRKELTMQKLAKKWW